MCDCHTDSELLTQFHEHGNMKMKDWKEYRLGEMIQCNPQVKLEKGKSYTLIDIDSIEIGSRYVKGKELTEYDGQSGCHFQNGDTVMARITPCLENGKIAQVQCESQKGFGSTELFVFRGMENKTDSNYVFNLMSMQFIRDLAANSMTGASGRQRADLGFIKRIKWNFPPLPAQQKIASILSAYDNLIQNYKKQIEALQTAASELYKEWFVRFRFPGWQTTNFENGIPEGWKVERLGNLAEIKSGKRLPQGYDFSDYPTRHPYIRARDIKHGNIDSNDFAYISDEVYQKLKRYIVDENDILLTIVANIGDVGYVNKSLQGFNLTENAVRLTNYSKRIEPRYLCYYLSQPATKIYMEGLAVGAAQAKLGIYKIETIKVLLPNINIQKDFSRRITLIHTKIDNLNKQITNLTQQRDLLLPRLMSGKLEI